MQVHHDSLNLNTHKICNCRMKLNSKDVKRDQFFLKKGILLKKIILMVENKILIIFFCRLPLFPPLLKAKMNIKILKDT